MKRFKIYALIIILLPLMLFSGMCAVNLSLDPDEIFKKSAEYPYIAIGNKRYKNAGVINQYDLKNLLVGGSLMDNMVASEVETALNWDKVFSLTLRGGQVGSVVAITQHAIRNHPIENVLFSLQPVRLASIAVDEPDHKRSTRNFSYLYDQNPINDLLAFAQFPAYFLKHTKRKKEQIAKLKTKQFPETSGDVLFNASKDLYGPYMITGYKEFNRPLFISSLGDASQPSKPLKEQYKQNLSENYAQHLQPLVTQNPNTNFIFVVQSKTFLDRKENLETFSYALKFLVDKLSQYPNVKIYNFANNDFNDDLRLFRDLHHPHIEISRYMLQSIAKDRHRVVPETVDTDIQTLKNILDNYQVRDIWKTEYHRLGDGPYPRKGYITYYDAAKLVWGDEFNDQIFNDTPRSPYLAEESYVTTEIKTLPPLDNNATKSKP